MCVKKEGGDGKRGNEKNQVNDKGVKRTGRDVESRHAPSIPHLEKLVDMAMVYSSCLPPCDSSQGGDGERVKRNAGAKSKQGQGESQDRLKALHDSHPLQCVWYLESSPATNITLPSESGSLKYPSSPSKRASPDRVMEVSASLCKEEQKRREGPREGQWCCSWSFPRGRPTGTKFSVKLFGYEEAKRLALYTALYAYSPEERCDVLQEPDRRGACDSFVGVALGFSSPQSGTFFCHSRVAAPTAFSLFVALAFTLRPTGCMRFSVASAFGITTLFVAWTVLSRT
ncbi:AP2 domain transcription factor AP2V-1 [Toxoplasma gondii VEG]|uniref:AP2 domain transcription factor AP2V-1 n=1 Tax=Toxoplasma gondii (strain ATCC 50861 / VEG) TaxID=432359 RepID=V4YJ74_TOXGV|nr:AP2 domain transcription factor AP2V-1 [Toxoplasma gondii VEG]